MEVFRVADCKVEIKKIKWQITMDSIAAMLKKIDHNLLHRKGFKLHISQEEQYSKYKKYNRYAINILSYKGCKKVNF